MTRAALVLTMVAMSACSQVPVPGSRSPEAVKLEAAEVNALDKPSVIVFESTARVRVWRRGNNTCYVSVVVPGLKPFFVDASGETCDEHREPSVILEKQK